MAPDKEKLYKVTGEIFDYIMKLLHQKFLNKYGMISGGHIFDIMDRYAHDLAEKYLGKCVTRNASINFLSPASDGPRFSHNIFVSSETKCEIAVYLINDNNQCAATATFTFVSIK